MTHLSWVALNGMAYSFIELHKPFCHDKRVIHKSILTAKPHQKSFILLVLQEEKQKTKKQTNNILHCVIHRDPLGMPPPLPDTAPPPLTTQSPPLLFIVILSQLFQRSLGLSPENQAHAQLHFPCSF